MKGLGLTVAATLLAGRPLGAQAPDLALLWRVSGGTLASPAPLQQGPLGLLWTPAAVHSAPGLALGLEVVHTPDVVSLSGVVAAATFRFGSGLSIGVTGGRASVGDLVRTTTSPVSEGEIQVYSQFVGAAAGTAVGPITLGAEVRLHDSRLDTRTDGGLTLDAGLRFRPFASLTIAAATQFAALDLAGHATTAYSGALEYRILSRPLWGGRASVLGRYGIDARGSGEVDHLLSMGLLLTDRIRLDVAAQWVDGYTTGSWQPVLGVGFRAGRYAVSVACGTGLNGLGATYRIGLHAGVFE